MSSPAGHDPYAALRISNYRDYLLGSFLALIGRQAITIAITWEIYQWTHSATALALVGFINVIPLLFLSLHAGSLADKYDRKTIIARGASFSLIISLSLALLSHYADVVPHWPVLDAINRFLSTVARLFEHHVNPASIHFDQPALPIMFFLLLSFSVVRILAWPARTSIIPMLLPSSALSNAITWNSSAFEIATVTGPAIGGFIIAYGGFQAVYLFEVALSITFLFLLRRVRYHHVETRPPEPAGVPGKRSWRGMLAGAEFIWNRKVILGASSLDLFATLLGGATALLPLYADTILHVGPIGLGWLRAAPSIGAFGMAMYIAHRRPLQKPGKTLLWGVAGFGVAIIVFGLSHWFWLSFVALVFTGIFDNISVVVRQTLIQLLTPDHLRGRVASVNQVFIGSSNEIGALRAGLMAAAFGPVFAAVFGGIGTIAVVGIVAVSIPALRKLAQLHTLKPD